MSITAMSGRAVSVYRRTAFVLDSTTPAAGPSSVSPSRQPTASTLLQVRATGSGFPGGGVSVTANWTGPSSEVFVFAGPGVQVGTLDVPSGSLLDFDLADFTGTQAIEVKAIGGDGSPNHAPYLLLSGLRVRFDRARPRWMNPASGGAETEKTRVYLDYRSDYSPREGDVFVDERTLEEWLLVGHPELMSGGSLVPHHFEFEVERRKQSVAS
jgi:hypothetical protein